jgi:hypothetical protein
MNSYICPNRIGISQEIDKYMLKSRKRTVQFYYKPIYVSLPNPSRGATHLITIVLNSIIILVIPCSTYSKTSPSLLLEV